MPRYFFNTFHDQKSPDWSGTELPDKDAAWEKATQMAGETIKRLDGALKPGHDWRMEVTDEFAMPLWKLHVRAQKK